MKTVFINKDNLLQGPYIQDATIAVEISDEEYDKVSVLPFNKAWKLAADQTFYLVDLLDINSLKERRNRECFRIIDNRSQLWFNKLTEQQKQDLDIWYQAWLDVTETKIIPEKPNWLE